MSEAINTYDVIPYESYPYLVSSPDHLFAISKLFKLDTPMPENSRILELGCASGGNIIPLAVKYPKAKIMGIDLSKVQTEEGISQIKALKLKNIEIKCCSIEEVDQSFGEFDYIIAHGIISWVPQKVRDKIFDIGKNNLSKNGVYYISYNTLPGWNMIRSIRDMMMYHANFFTSQEDKIQQGKLLLDFIRKGVSHFKSPYSEILSQEADILSKQSDHYIRHDHLEENNKQYYFHEFIQEAGQRGLKYLGDSKISSMYLGNMPEEVSEKLQVVDDPVRKEQYMDYITNRRFRTTLLCHQSAEYTWNLQIEQFKDFDLSLTIASDGEMKNIEDATESHSFFLNRDQDNKITTTSPVMKSILTVFSENINFPISLEELVKLSDAKLKGNRKKEIEIEFLNNAGKLFFSGYLEIHPKGYLRNCTNIVSDKPKIWEYSRFQISNTGKSWVTNLMHKAVMLNIFDKYVMRYADGKHTHEQIVEKLEKHMEAGEFTFSKNEKQLSKKDAQKELKLAIESSFKKYAESALLVS